MKNLISKKALTEVQAQPADRQGLQIGDTIRHSGHVIQRARDYWLSCGRQPMKEGARADLEKKTAARGTVTDIKQGQYATVICSIWNDGHTSECLDYMIEKDPSPVSQSSL